MYYIRKQFFFSAAHQLKGLPESHPCSRLHGHNYKVELVLRKNFLNDVDFIRDYRELDEFKVYLDIHVEHRNLNEVFDGMQTTAENLAFTFYDYCISKYPELYEVNVSETDKTWATYRPSE